MAKALRERVNLVGIATIVLIALLWEGAIKTKVIELNYLSAPSEIVTALYNLAVDGELWQNVGHTLSSALIGWVLAGVVGIVFGIVLGTVWPVWRYSMASVDAVRSLPIVAFVPVAVLLLGFSRNMEVLVAFSGAVWPILINTQAGVRSLPQRMLEVGSVLDLRRSEVMLKLRLPASVPSIVVGLRLGLSISLILTLVAEMIGNPAGIGFAIVQKAATLKPEQMFAYVIVTGLLGVILNTVLMTVCNRVFRDHMAAAGENA